MPLQRMVSSPAVAVRLSGATDGRRRFCAGRKWVPQAAGQSTLDRAAPGSRSFLESFESTRNSFMEGPPAFHYGSERSSAVNPIPVIASDGFRETQRLGIPFVCVLRGRLGSQFRQLVEKFEGGAEILHPLFQLHRQRTRQFPNLLLARGDGFRRVINNRVSHAMESQQIFAKARIADQLDQ